MNERIKEVRKVLNMTQTEFGERIGMTASGISRLESGDTNPIESTIKLICATYNVDYRWLTTGQGEMFLPMDTDALVDKYLAGESELTRTIMKAFARLPDEEWHKLADLIERIKKEGV